MWKIELEIDFSKLAPNNYTDLSDALDKKFAYSKDRIYLIMDNSKIELPLAYGFSDLLETIIYLLENICHQTQGEGLYGFPQNDFFDCDWKIGWNVENLSIEFEWRSVKEGIIEEFPKMITTTKREFLESWKTVFQKLFEVISRENLSDPWDYDKIQKLLDS